MTKEEKNQRLAEWLEPKPTWKFADSEHDDSGICWMYSDGGCYQRMYIEGHLDLEQTADFFTDESASALVLEKMPDPNLWLESSKGEPVLWGCWPDMDLDVVAFDADRKTAIAEACLKFLSTPHASPTR